eukprot:IDg1178t1
MRIGHTRSHEPPPQLGVPAEYSIRVKTKAKTQGANPTPCASAATQRPGRCHNNKGSKPNSSSQSVQLGVLAERTKRGNPLFNDSTKLLGAEALLRPPTPSKTRVGVSRPTR